MTIEVRPAELTDAEAIARVDLDSHYEAYRPYYGDDYMAGATIERFTERWQRILREKGPPERAPEQVIVAEREGEVIGYSGFGRCRDEDARDCGELGSIYVHPEHWRSGAGTVLIEAVTQRLADLGFAVAVLWVLDENSRARAFYERQGWSADGTTLMRDDGHLQVRYRLQLT